ncbi:inositol monophosphatase [Patescibacteria group bacterium]|nr:inositol monophosphatase [Patescibacteria group bacterium]
MSDDYLQFAKDLAKKGGVILKENFGRLKQSQIELKGPHDFVTEIDKKVEAMYVNEIRKAFPEHGIIGEEGTSDNPDNEWVWVLDPLDGTKNYSFEVPFFCTSICLLKNKEPVVAVIYEPITDHLFYATKEGGAFKNDERIHVSKTDTLESSMLLYCHAPAPDAIQQAERYVIKLKTASRDASRLRSAGSEMALVAKGVCEAYLMNKLPLWDLAAGALLVREAGGKATDFTGKDWRPGDKNILVSNGTQIHNEILDIVRESIE